MNAAQRISHTTGRNAGSLRGSDFSHTMRSGVRVGSRDLTIHVLNVGTDWPDPSGARRDVALAGGPWLGLIVSKAVGNSVVRHHVARRLRAAFAYASTTLDLSETSVVVRARPSVAGVDSVELGHQLTRAVAKVIG